MIRNWTLIHGFHDINDMDGYQRREVNADAPVESQREAASSDNCRQPEELQSVRDDDP